MFVASNTFTLMTSTQHLRDSLSRHMNTLLGTDGEAHVKHSCFILYKLHMHRLYRVKHSHKSLTLIHHVHNTNTEIPNTQ